MLGQLPHVASALSGFLVIMMNDYTIGVKSDAKKMKQFAEMTE